MKSQIPLVTFIIPAYNRREKLEKAIDSVLNQTYVEIELILIDDGSYPSLEPYFEQVKERDDRVRYFINFENEGVSFSRNLGLSKAKGEYVCFVDSDDYLFPNRLMDQQTFFFNNDLLVCDYYLENIYEKHRRVIVQNPEFDVLSRIVNRSLHLATLAVIWKKSFLVENTLIFKTELRNSEDYLFMVQALLKNPKIHYINKPLVVVVKSHEDSLTGKFKLRLNTKNKFISHFKVFQLTLGRVSIFESFKLLKKIFGFGLHFLVSKNENGTCLTFY